VKTGKSTYNINRETQAIELLGNKWIVERLVNSKTTEISGIYDERSTHIIYKLSAPEK
jgi:hypothetical protein